jgi:protein-S-isoprenylcysteine O-methyltransferase Ste14
MTSDAQPLRILGYVWAFFGAFWMSIGLLANSTAKSETAGRRARFAFLAATFILLFRFRSDVPPAVLLLLGLAWAALGLSWAAARNSAHSGEFPWYRPLRLLILATTFSLLFWDATAKGFLGRHFLPADSVFVEAGLVTALAGMGLTLWARMVLGSYWSDKVVLQGEHRLVQAGPYARMRHPIYSGVLLGVLGTALVLGEWRGALAFVLLLTNYVIKAKREEHILATRFQEEFSAHAARTGFFLPRLRRSERPGGPISIQARDESAPDSRVR